MIDTVRIYRELLREYGSQGWWPLFSRRDSPGHDGRGYGLSPRQAPLTREERFEIVMGAILTQNTSWKNVEQALERVFTAGIDSPERLADIPVEELETLIRPSGYYRQKARRLKGVTGILFGRAEDTAPDREFLLGISGIGAETADSILLYAYDTPSFIADLYTRRFVMRLARDAKMGEYEQVRSLFEETLVYDASLFAEYHALIVRHGKEHCGAKLRCGGCPCRDSCLTGRTVSDV
jgi:endonuclease III related protein